MTTSDAVPSALFDINLTKKSTEAVKLKYFTSEVIYGLEPF